MKRALQTYTPRVKPLKYDALRNTIGCQAISGTQVFYSKPFIRICVEA